MRIPALGMVCIVIVGFAGLGRAQSQDDEARAKAHFAAGSSYYEESRFEEAAREFQQAYRLSGRPVLLINIARSFEHSMQYDRAIEAYEQYLQKAPDAQDRATIEARLDHARKMAARLKEKQAVASDDPNGGAIPEPETEPAETEPDKREPGDEPEAAEKDIEAGESQTPKTETSDDTGGRSLLLPLVVGGAGAAMLIGGSVTGVLALSQQAELDDNCPDRTCAPRYQDDIDSAKTMVLVTDILLIGGGVLVATAAVIFLLSSGGQAEAEIGAAAQPMLLCHTQGCAAAATVRF